MGLTGYVSSTRRGKVAGFGISGCDQNYTCTVGQSTASSFPCYQWKGINKTTTKLIIFFILFISYY
jgi:hypothetical protein